MEPCKKIRCLTDKLLAPFYVNFCQLCVFEKDGKVCLEWRAYLFFMEFIAQSEKFLIPLDCSSQHFRPLSLAKLILVEKPAFGLGSRETVLRIRNANRLVTKPGRSPIVSTAKSFASNIFFSSPSRILVWSNLHVPIPT